jgi:hypothetical protein
MFTSSWGQQNQQQQQQQQPQQQTGAFGQPSGFGATANNNGEFSFLTHHSVYKPPRSFRFNKCFCSTPATATAATSG